MNAIKEAELPLVTVVTVVYNGQDELEKTILSVLNQSYTNIEYIIIDGASTDGTLEIANKYKDRISRIVSEKDNGIYDAMNKGASLASGTWINYMNAGDLFYDNHVLERVFACEEDVSGYDFVYGDYYWHNADKASFLIKSRPLDQMWKKISFAHQSLFTKVALMQSRKFDTSFKIVADYEFYYSCYKDGYSFYHAKTPVSVFTAGGVSDENFLLRTFERLKVVIRYDRTWNIVKHYATLLAEHYWHARRRKKTQNKRPGFSSSRKKLVSVVVPNFNNAEFLRDCIDSVLNQSYPEIDLVFVDDGSSDASMEVIGSYDDPRIRVFRNSENIGISATRNQAISHALGEYITTLDSDDVFLDENKIESEMALIEHYREHHDRDVIAFSNVMFIDRSGASYQLVGDGNIEEGNIFNGILARRIFIPRDYMCKKQLIEAVGGYDEQIPLYEDWDLKLRLAQKADYYYTGLTGIGYRRHGEGLSAAPEKELEHWRAHIANKYLARS